ncbi:D-amino-acid transaminase [Campylobacter sp. faydin G-24]|uniref:branched-chain-amino-acid transaminase n=1 Tax=Campylobacter anatolicus TaxID=2829105 RepID=A0ABS5HKG6_9BACT|nr:D-amino-acid transaminase [Campylobacter anatolicus]MBR8462705.1 D-amino-acid transaminase [Campylobacter anatolicus]MBR8464127.1 D-amino-acid transaminase [Campylobacter anatolicus]MBR8466032.1 D-amino-acid transaminase [Campylobacter anatolicus]
MATNLDIVFINGEFLPSSEAKISAFDRGFIFGDGIYEVVPVVNSRLVDRDDFWERFERSLMAIELKLPYKKEKFEEILYEVITQNGLKEGGVYLQITRGAAPRDFYFVNGLTPSVFVFCYEANVIDNPLAKSGIEIVSVEDIRWSRRDIKSISLLAQCYAKNEAHKRGAYEGLMVQNGFVTEGCSSSAFIIKDKTLITKPLSNEILPGIRRKTLLKFAELVGLKVEQREFSIDEVYGADEAFISAATLILLPIIKADGRFINGGKVGKYAIKLRELYVRKMLDEAGV